MEDLKKDIEKYKNDKVLLNEKIKNLQNQLESVQAESNYDDKYSVDTKNIPMDEKEKQEILDNLKSSFEVLKKKLEIYKDTIEDLNNKDLKIKDLEKKIFQLKKERDSNFEEALYEEKNKFEEEIENIKIKHREEILRLKEEIEHINSDKSNEIMKGTKPEPVLSVTNDEEVKSLKNQLLLSEKIMRDMKNDWELMKKLKINMDAKIKEQDIKLKEYEETIKKLKGINK